MVHLQTDEMKPCCARNPEMLMIDSTYHLNTENHCMCTIRAQDENGFGQPVAIGLLKNEPKHVLRRFFCHVKKKHRPQFLYTSLFCGK